MLILRVYRISHNYCSHSLLTANVFEGYMVRFDIIFVHERLPKKTIIEACVGNNFSY